MEISSNGTFFLKAVWEELHSTNDIFGFPVWFTVSKSQILLSLHATQIFLRTSLTFGLRFCVWKNNKYSVGENFLHILYGTVLAAKLAFLEIGSKIILKFDNI